MHLLDDKSGIPRIYHPRKPHLNGPGKTEWNQRLASTDNGKTSMILPEIWKLLSTIYTQIWKHHPTPEWPTKERRKVWMDTRMTGHLRHLEATLHWITSITNARLVKTLHFGTRCLLVCLQSSLITTRQQWRLAPLCLPVQILQWHRTQLWHLG